MKIIAPQKEIKPKVYQLNAEQTLFLGGLARFDYVQGAKSSFIAYVSNDLKLHRTKTATADAFMKNMLVAYCSLHVPMKSLSFLN